MTYIGLLEGLTEGGRQYVLVGDHAVSGDIRYMQVNSVYLLKNDSTRISRHIERNYLSSVI